MRNNLVDAAPQLALFGDSEMAPAVAPSGSIQSIYVHFEEMADVEAFGRLIGQPVTTQTLRICYPPEAAFDGCLYLDSLSAPIPATTAPPACEEESEDLSLDPFVAEALANLIEKRAMLSRNAALVLANDALALVMESIRRDVRVERPL